MMNLKNEMEKIQQMMAIRAEALVKKDPVYQKLAGKFEILLTLQTEQAEVKIDE